MARKYRYDEFTGAVKDLLYRYAEDFTIDFFAETKKLAQKGARELRAESKKQFGKGDYAKSWKVYAHEGRLKTTCIIYSVTPSLPHLLEYSHRIVNKKDGPGATNPHPHIKPVEEKLIKEYEKYLQNWFR